MLNPLVAYLIQVYQSKFAPDASGINRLSIFWHVGADSGDIDL